MKVHIKDVDPRLFSDIAKKAAEACSNRKDVNKTTQLRRFYDELVMWHDKVSSAKTSQEQAERFKELEPYIQMMRAKVAYAKGRNLVDDTFYKLFDQVIDEVSDAGTLKNARLFMEAFMGFKKYFEKN